jgi:hypothetical protein
MFTHARPHGLSNVTDTVNMSAQGRAMLLQSLPTPAQLAAVSAADAEKRRESQREVDALLAPAYARVAQRGVRNAKNAWKVPRPLAPNRLMKQVFQTMVSIRGTFNTSGSGLTEVNYSWNLQSHPQYSALAGLFDQYCILKVEVKFMASQNTYVADVHTAIDYDNIGNLSSVTLIDQYTNVIVRPLLGAKSFTRVIFPAIGADLSGVGGAGVNTSWVDSNNQTIPHLGFRSITPTMSTAVEIITEQRIWYAFRNGL